MRNILITILMLAGSLVTASPNGVVQEEMKVNLVELDVKAVSLTGDFISGLSPDQFVVKENGVVQEIVAFDEITTEKLAPSERDTYRSRVMILLDLKNTSYNHMRRVFPQLRDYVLTQYNGKSEIGIAVNAGAISEVIAFTSDKDELFKAIDKAQAFYKKSIYRTVNPAQKFTIPAADVFGFPTHGSAQSFGSSYYRKEMEILGQFVHYLGTYSGRKNLVLISERWQPSSLLDEEGSLDVEGVISMKDIETACVFNKIAINVISLNPETSLAENKYGLHNRVGFRYFEPHAELAHATAGFYFTANRENVANMLEETVTRAERYYRIRYYSSYNGAKYRRIGVSAKGAARSAFTFAGYYPNRGLVDAGQVTNDWQVTRQQAAINLNTDWLHWEWSGFKKRRAYYAVGVRAYDAQGSLISEKVSAGQLEKRKYGGTYEARKLDLQVPLDLPNQSQIARIELVVTDLSTGKKVTLDNQGNTLI